MMIWNELVAGNAHRLRGFSPAYDRPLVLRQSKCEGAIARLEPRSPLMSPAEGEGRRGDQPEPKSRVTSRRIAAGSISDWPRGTRPPRSDSARPHRRGGA